MKTNCITNVAPKWVPKRGNARTTEKKKKDR